MLMLCCSESGHSNVFLATAHSLLERNPAVELHLASFAPLQKAFGETTSHPKCEIKAFFHTVNGPPIFEVLDRDRDPNMRMLDVARLTPGFWNTPTAIRFFLIKMLTSWTPEEYVTMFHQLCSLIKVLEPDAVIVDALFSPGLSASQHVNRLSEKPKFKLAVLSPNSLKDFTCHLEGGSTEWTKWPVHGAALSMPLTWYGMLQNWYFHRRIVRILTHDTEIPAWDAEVRRRADLPDMEVASMLTLIGGGAAHMDRLILGSSPELDFPTLDVEAGPAEYRRKIVPCGPILRTAVPLGGSDPELMAWARDGRVVYINLGTLCRVEEHEMLEMARAFRILLDKAGDKSIRVLWKLAKEKKRGEDYSTGPESAVHQILGKEMDEDRVRIVEWVKGEPAALLDSGAVTCSINHGGASSFYEAVL